MSLRDLTHPPSCPGTQSSANPLSALADNLLPQSSRTDPPLAHIASSSKRPVQPQVSDIEAALLHAPLPQLDATAPPSLRGGATDIFERAFLEGRATRPAMPMREEFARKRPSSAGFAAGLQGVGGGVEFARVWKGGQTGIGRGGPNGFAEEFARMGLGRVGSSGGASMFLGARGPYTSPWRWGGFRDYALASSTAAMEREREEVERNVEREGGGGVVKEKEDRLKPSVSWGDEFTSLEEAVGKHAERANEAGFFADEDTFERMYEAAFHEYVGVEERQREYRFGERDQVMGRSALEALEEGVRMRESGRLSMAIALFEEALNRNVDDPHPPLEKGLRAKAWFLLGMTLADSDDDEMAIVALRNGLNEFDGDAIGERRRDHPYLLQSLLALSVSYTNELDHLNAYANINEWFTVWKAGKGVSDVQADVFGDAFQDATKAGAQRLLSEMNTAAQQNSRDTDLYVVMGVLYNLQRECTHAATVLRQAVTLRPNDPSLWNKLGATLANGGEGDDALRAYRRAVDINPALVRAWVNVGTAYSNRQEYAKAARYYLKSLSLTLEHDVNKKNELSGHQDRMGHVWGYLRTALISMSRADILHHVDARDVDALRSVFNF